MLEKMRGCVTPSMAVSVTALVFATTGSAFAAKAMITGADIKNGSITSADIADGSLSTRDIEGGSINLDRLSEGSQNRINEKPRDGKDGVNGKDGAKGADGVNGAAGAKGETGATGDAGAKGADGQKGDKGDLGNDGADAAHAVESLVPYAADEDVEQNGEWRSYASTGAAAPTVDADGIKFGQYADGGQWTNAYTYAVKGARLKDVALLAYSARFTGGAENGASPYFIIVTEGGDQIAFTPKTQTGVQPKENSWQRWVVTQGTVRFNDTAGNGPGMTWDALLTGHEDDKIDYIALQAGNGGAFTNGSTSHVRNVTMEVTGAEATFGSYTFGS